jgi:hypothetical protein
MPAGSMFARSAIRHPHRRWNFGISFITFPGDRNVESFIGPSVD